MLFLKESVFRSRKAKRKLSPRKRRFKKRADGSGLRQVNKKDTHSCLTHLVLLKFSLNSLIRKTLLCKNTVVRLNLRK